MNSKRVADLKESIARFEDVIATFEHSREQIVQRRQGAADHVMPILDERLKLNGQTLECLKRGLELAREHLKIEESES